MMSIISEDQEKLLKSTTVQTIVEIKPENRSESLRGSGVILVTEQSPNYAIVLTAKHCILGKCFQFNLSQINKLYLRHKYNNEDSFSVLEISTDSLILPEGDKDLAIIIVDRKQLTEAFKIVEIPIIKLSKNFRHEFYDSNGYPNAFSKNDLYHYLHSRYKSDQGKYFETTSVERLFPGTGEKAITTIQGFSGSGVFKKNLDYLTGLVIELKSTTGDFDALHCIKLDDLNDLLVDNEFGIPKLEYTEDPSFEHARLGPKSQLVSEVLERVIPPKTKEKEEVELISNQDRIKFSQPPLGQNFTKREELVQKYLKKLKNKLWVHIFGSIGYGKTQITNLVSRGFNGNTIWIRLRNSSNIKETILQALAISFSLPSDTINIFETLGGKSIGSHLIVLDDLPHIGKEEEIIDLIRQLVLLCKETGIRIISNSNHRFSSTVKEYIEEDTILEEVTPSLNVGEVSDVLSLHGASKEIIEKYSSFIQNHTKGHPFIVNQVIRFISSHNWTTTEEQLTKIFDYDFSTETSIEIQSHLGKSISGQDARTLLYRLCLVKGSFSFEEIQTVAAVKPSIETPLEKVALIKDLWIQQDSESTYVVSPLLNFINSKNLPPELVSEINFSLGRLILTKRKFDQFQAAKAITYFWDSKAMNEAAFVLILSLQEFSKHPKFFYDSLFFLFWYYNEIPESVNINSRIYIRILQISISLAEKKDGDVLFLLRDLEKLVTEAARIGIEVSHAQLLLSILYGQIDVSKANEYLISGLRGHDNLQTIASALAGEPDENLPDSGPLLWIPLFYAKDAEGIKNCLQTFKQLHSEKKVIDLKTDLRIIPITKAFVSVYQSELDKNFKVQNWDKLLKDINEIAADAYELSLDLFFSYAIRVKIWISSIQLDKKQEAITTALEAIENVSYNPDATFLIYDALAKGLYDSGSEDDSLQYFDKAIEIDTNLVLFEKLSTLDFLSNLFYEQDPMYSLSLSKQACSLALNSQRIPLVTRVNMLGEYAINQWNNGNRKEALYTLEKGYELLLKSNEENDLWKVSLIRYGHTFNYFYSIVTQGIPPEQDINGEPYSPPTKNFFTKKHHPELIENFYFKERRFMASWMVLNCFQYLEDILTSQKWTDYLIRECRLEEPKYFQFLRIRISVYFILEDQFSEALRNCFKAWDFQRTTSKQELIEKAPQVFLADMVKKQPEFQDRGFTSLALANVITVATFKLLVDYLDGRNNFQSFIEVLKEWENSEEANWSSFIHLFSLAAKGLNDYHRIHDYVNRYEGDYKGYLQIIGYMLASIHAPTKKAYQFQLNLFPELEQLLQVSTPGALPFLVIPFFTRYWEKKFAENLSDFEFKDFWFEKSYPRFKNAASEKKLKCLFQALSHHLNIDLPSKQEDWIDDT